jgi:hypothetical protein
MLRLDSRGDTVWNATLENTKELTVCNGTADSGIVIIASSDDAGADISYAAAYTASGVLSFLEKIPVRKDTLRAIFPVADDGYIVFGDGIPADDSASDNAYPLCAMLNSAGVATRVSALDTANSPRQLMGAYPVSDYRFFTIFKMLSGNVQAAIVDTTGQASSAIDAPDEFTRMSTYSAAFAFLRKSQSELYVASTSTADIFSYNIDTQMLSRRLSPEPPLNLNGLGINMSAAKDGGFILAKGDLYRFDSQDNFVWKKSYQSSICAAIANPDNTLSVLMISNGIAYINRFTANGTGIVGFFE